MKPRIFKRGSLWYCKSRMAWAPGYTPADAYANWRWLMGR